MITEREIFLTNPDEKAAVIEFLKEKRIHIFHMVINYIDVAKIMKKQ